LNIYSFGSKEIISIYGDTVVFEFTVFLSGENHSPQYPNFKIVNDPSTFHVVFRLGIKQDVSRGSERIRIR
jgi:hypothetical protein